MAFLLDQGRAFVADGEAEALRKPVGTSRAFEEAVAARAEYHRVNHFTSMVSIGGTLVTENARLVTETLASDFQNLAIAELLGAAAPRASPRVLQRDDLEEGVGGAQLEPRAATHQRRRAETSAQIPELRVRILALAEDDCDLQDPTMVTALAALAAAEEAALAPPDHMVF